LRAGSSFGKFGQSFLMTSHCSLVREISSKISLWSMIVVSVCINQPSLVRDYFSKLSGIRGLELRINFTWGVILKGRHDKLR
jgi:hypothetical protein